VRKGGGFFFDWGGFRRHGQVVSKRRKNGYGADPYLASFDETLKEEEGVHSLSLRKTDTNKHIHLGPRKIHSKITTSFWSGARVTKCADGWCQMEG
jgi:hypothetical protein